MRAGGLNKNVACHRSGTCRCGIYWGIGVAYSGSSDPWVDVATETPDNALKGETNFPASKDSGGPKPSASLYDKPKQVPRIA